MLVSEIKRVKDHRVSGSGSFKVKHVISALLQ